MEQLIECRRINPRYRLVARDQPFIRHIDRDFERSLCGSLARTRLEHPQRAAFNSKFNILHVAVMRFEDRENRCQLRVDLGHRFFHAQRLGVRTFPCRAREILRRADPRDDIFTLRVDQKFAVIGIFARRGIARERHAGRRCFAHIAKHHRLNIDRSTPVTGNAVQTPVNLRAVRLP